MRSPVRSTTIHRALCVAICVAASAAIGCSTSKDAGGGDDDQGSSGKGSSGKSGEVVFVDAGDPSKPVKCGTKTCKANDDGNPCCVDEGDAICGILAENTQCVTVADPRCPSVPNKDLGMDLVSCCTPDGMCGVDFSFFGQGCVDLGDETFRMSTPDAPKARPCDAD